MSSSTSMQGQLPLSFFDKSFSDNPGDVLFCCLNEIEPVFLEQESSSIGGDFIPQVVDPRNKMPVTQTLYDNTVCKRPELFKSSTKSQLKKTEHTTCLAILQSIKAKQQIFPHQLQCFNETAQRRKKEKDNFTQLLLQFNNANYDKIYAPGVIFVELYREYYKCEAQRLMEKHKDGIFQVHTGFPIPWSCGNSEMLGVVSDVEELRSCEGVPWLGSYMDLTKMKPRMGTYLDLYKNGSEENDDKLAKEQRVQFEISTEALVFLLCAGEYIDTPTEALLTITEGDGEDNFIHLHDPLPSRNAGAHTGELMVGKCAEVFLRLKQSKTASEIQATGFNKPYALQSIEAFMEKQKTKTSCSAVSKASNLVKWCLGLENDDKSINILTRTQVGQRDALERRPIYHSIKLEYKPQFGCEIPSKVSLLREWITQRLSASVYSSTDRHRISASTLETVLHENLTLADIESELERFYNTKMPRLLGSLADFLGLLCKVPPGRYMLRFNPRFQDKLMLLAETKESTSKTSVTLHGLLLESPSDMAFMTLRQLTPIDDSLCSAVHDFYQVLPCSFPPWRRTQPHKLIDDRSFILSKVKKKIDLATAKEKRLIENRKKRKRIAKTRKIKMQNQEKREAKKEQRELEEEINNDRVFYGFAELDEDSE